MERDFEPMKKNGGGSFLHPLAEHSSDSGAKAIALSKLHRLTFFSPKPENLRRNPLKRDAHRLPIPKP